MPKDFKQKPKSFGTIYNSLHLDEGPCSVIVAVGLLAASLASFLFLAILVGHPVTGNVSIAPYFLHLMMTSSLFSMVYLLPWKFICAPTDWFSWLTPFNNEISLMLWKCSVDHGFRCKMSPRKCQEKPTRTTELYSRLIRGTLNNGRCVLTPTLTWILTWSVHSEHSHILSYRVILNGLFFYMTN